jgi:glycosyltransferase involved in cell wall biosynthesis
MTALRPLRILLVGDYPDDVRLGSAKVVHKLRDEFRAAGHVCDALFSDVIGARPRSRQIRQLVAPVLAGRAIRRAFTRAAYDVVDVSSAEGLWFGVNRRLGRLPNTVFICRSHGLEHLNYRRMLDDSEAGLRRKPWARRMWYPVSRLTQVAAAARCADRLIVVNDSDRRFAERRGWQTADRIHVVPHGVSDRFLSEYPRAARGGAGMLFCGAWDHVKGIAYLTRAFDDLAAHGRPVPLTVLGPGLPAGEVLASFSEAARPHVTVLDRLPEERVIAEYGRHDALVFPSTYEGFGLVVLEAMSQGLPVVATAVGCVPAFVVDGVSGLIVPPRDVSALAGAIRRLADDPALRNQIGASAARAVRGVSWRDTAARTLDVYRAALAEGRPS